MEAEAKPVPDSVERSRLWDRCPAPIASAAGLAMLGAGIASGTLPEVLEIGVVAVAPGPVPGFVPLPELVERVLGVDPAHARLFAAGLGTTRPGPSSADRPIGIPVREPARHTIVARAAKPSWRVRPCREEGAAMIESGEAARNSEWTDCANAASAELGISPAPPSSPLRPAQPAPREASIDRHLKPKLSAPVTEDEEELAGGA